MKTQRAKLRDKERNQENRQKEVVAFTLMQDSRYAAFGDLSFALGVEVVGIIPSECARVETMGGIVFTDKEDAEIFAFCVNWQDNKSIPWVHGRFPEFSNGKTYLRLYVPTNKERAWAGAPEFPIPNHVPATNYPKPMNPKRKRPFETFMEPFNPPKQVA